MNESSMSLFTKTVVPESDYIAGVLNAELVKPYDPSLEFEFLTDEIPEMQEDATSKSTRVLEQFKSGIINLETAIEELGYDMTQAGEGVPTFSQSLQAGGQAETNQKPFGGKAELGKQLEQYKKFRINRLGKEVREFESDIPVSLKAALDVRLAKAETQEDIERAFQSAVVWAGYA